MIKVIARIAFILALSSLLMPSNALSQVGNSLTDALQLKQTPAAYQYAALDSNDYAPVSRFPQFWISGGLSGSNEGFGYTISSSYARKNHTIITARLMSFRPLDLVYPANITSPSFSDEPSATEFAALYGVIADGKYGQASLSGGIGWTMFANRPPYPGIALEARASVTAPILGIGVKAFGNFTGRYNIWGIGAFLELGKLSVKNY